MRVLLGLMRVLVLVLFWLRGCLSCPCWFHAGFMPIRAPMPLCGGFGGGGGCVGARCAAARHHRGTRRDTIVERLAHEERQAFKEKEKRKRMRVVL